MRKDKISVFKIQVVKFREFFLLKEPSLYYLRLFFLQTRNKKYSGHNYFLSPVNYTRRNRSRSTDFPKVWTRFKVWIGPIETLVALLIDGRLLVYNPVKYSIPYTIIIGSFKLGYSNVYFKCLMDINKVGMQNLIHLHRSD